MFSYIVKLLVTMILYMLLCAIYGVDMDSDSYHVGLALIAVLAPWIIDID